MDLPDLGLFIDYAVIPRADGRATVRNNCTGEETELSTLGAAVDYAAAHTNTLSPRLPAGYRSQTVRMLDSIGANNRQLLMHLAEHGERIDIEHTEIEDPCSTEDTAAQGLRTAAAAYLRCAVEAEEPSEVRAWLERAADLLSAASRQESRNAPTDSQERENDGGPPPEPWRYVTSRGGRPARHQRQRS